jgi:hypothetical protein
MTTSSSIHISSSPLVYHGTQLSSEDEIAALCGAVDSSTQCPHLNNFGELICDHPDFQTCCAQQVTPQAHDYAKLHPYLSWTGLDRVKHISSSIPILSSPQMHHWTQLSLTMNTLMMILLLFAMLLTLQHSAPTSTTLVNSFVITLIFRLMLNMSPLTPLTMLSYAHI